VKPPNAAVGIADATQVYVHDVIDPEAERQSLEKQKEQITNALKPTQAKLSNENFINRAKPEVVAQAREKLANLEEQLETIDRHLMELNN
jgi:valyl-tRNA synthetase